jgi:shikimate kinase
VCVSRPHNIILIGFMGSGKSSIGKLIAGRLGYLFVDTDALVVQRAGMEISEIFRTEGEERFRDLETEVLESLRERQRCVVATGGGLVLRKRNRELLDELGFVALLTADEEVIFERVSRNSRRPLLQTENPRETVRALLASRRPAYEAAAQWTLDSTSLSHGQAADAVIAEARRVFAWQGRV